AGLAAGRAAGKPWETLVVERLFRPLEMTAASCTTPASAERASPHRPDAGGRLRVIPWYAQPIPNPAGSIHASAHDLVGWLQFQLGDGTFHGRKLLSARALAETHTPQFALRSEGIASAATTHTHP